MKRKMDGKGEGRRVGGGTLHRVVVVGSYVYIIYLTISFSEFLGAATSDDGPIHTHAHTYTCYFSFFNTFFIFPQVQRRATTGPYIMLCV